jgi:hypothetical protein
VGSVLDAAALYLSTMDLVATEGVADTLKGPMLALAYGMPSLVRVGRSAGLPINPPDTLLRLLARATEEPPPVSIQRQEYLAALDRLDSFVTVPQTEREQCWRRFAWVRSGYDQALRGLAGLTLSPAAEWTTDRPARVGRPRLILPRAIRVEWELDAPT